MLFLREIQKNGMKQPKKDQKIKKLICFQFGKKQKNTELLTQKNYYIDLNYCTSNKKIKKIKLNSFQKIQLFFSMLSQH